MGAQELSAAFFHGDQAAQYQLGGPGVFAGHEGDLVVAQQSGDVIPGQLRAGLAAQVEHDAVVIQAHGASNRHADGEDLAVGGGVVGHLGIDQDVHQVVLGDQTAEIHEHVVGNDHLLDPLGITALDQEGQRVGGAQLLDLVGVHILGQLFQRDVILALVGGVEALDQGLKEDGTDVFAGLVGREGYFDHSIR